MKKLILFLIIISIAAVVFAQETPPPSQYLKPVNGQFYMDTRDSSIWQYMGTPYGWQKKARFKDVLLYGDAKFNNDLTVYLPAGYTFGKYTNGAVIPSAGKTAAEVITDAIKVAIPPIYTAPTTAVSGNPTPGTYEIGSIINVTLGSVFTQNDGGSTTGTTYYRGTTALGSNTDVIASLTSAISYKVTSAYAQGACKPNNLEVTDCTGRIEAGTATSSTITYSPVPKRYAVWLSDTTGIKTTGFNDALITAATLVNQLSSSKSYSFSTGSATGKFLAIVYIASAGALSSLSINGVGSIGAFNNVTRSFTNAQGYAQRYRIYWNTQAQTTTGYDIITN